MFLSVKTVSKLNMEYDVRSQLDISEKKTKQNKTSRRGSSSSDNVE